MAVRTISKYAGALTTDELYLQGKHIAEHGEVKPAGKVSSYNARTSKVFARYWVAAERGHVKAMREIADMFFYGKRYFVREGDLDPKNGGLTADYARALRWYEKLTGKGIHCPEHEPCRQLFLEQLEKQRTKQRK
jgi:TPR repeat protein